MAKSKSNDPLASLRQMAENASWLVVLLTSDGLIEFANPYCQELTGYETDELKGRTFFEVFRAQGETTVLRDELGRINRGEVEHLQVEICLQDKSEKECQLVCNAQPFDSERGPKTLLVGYNVASLREHRNSLQDSDDRLRSVLETAVDGILTIDPRGIIQSVNPAAEVIFGYHATEMIGRNIKMLMPQPYHDEHDGYLANYLRTGQKKIIGIGREAAALRKDGAVIPIDLAISEVRNSSNHFFTGIVRDISERRHAEERLLRSERLAAIGEMMTGLAHESKNAFQRIQACLEILEMELEEEQSTLELVQRAQKACHHLHHLYEEVRGYAAPIVLHVEEYQVRDVWRDAWASIELQRRGKEVVLDEQLRCDDLQCQIDPFALEQVFRNLLENAVTACPQPGKIEIECSSGNSDDSSLQVVVRDNGPGFSQGAKQKAFEPFFTTRAQGTGLGMAIAHRIIVAHGGNISIGDGPGGEIVLVLPRTKGP